METFYMVLTLSSLATPSHQRPKSNDFCCYSKSDQKFRIAANEALGQIADIGLRAADFNWYS